MKSRSFSSRPSSFCEPSSSQKNVDASISSFIIIFLSWLFSTLSVTIEVSFRPPRRVVQRASRSVGNATWLASPPPRLNEIIIDDMSIVFQCLGLRASLTMSQSDSKMPPQKLKPVAKSGINAPIVSVSTAFDALCRHLRESGKEDDGVIL